MKTFEVCVEKKQYIMVTVEASSKSEAMEKAENPEAANWYHWDSCEEAEYRSAYLWPESRGSESLIDREMGKFDVPQM